MVEDDTKQETYTTQKTGIKDYIFSIFYYLVVFAIIGLAIWNTIRAQGGVF